MSASKDSYVTHENLITTTKAFQLKSLKFSLLINIEFIRQIKQKIYRMLIQCHCTYPSNAQNIFSL